MRETEVTVARPHRYWATAIPAKMKYASPFGSTRPRIQPKLLGPIEAAWAASGMAATTAHSITQPDRPETATAVTMPLGTRTAAPTVSSAVLAEASKPVIVYAGSRKLNAKSRAMLLVSGQTSPPRAPLKFEKVTSDPGCNDGAKES